MNNNDRSKPSLLMISMEDLTTLNTIAAKLLQSHYDIEKGLDIAITTSNGVRVHFTQDTLDSDSNVERRAMRLMGIPDVSVPDIPPAPIYEPIPDNPNSRKATLIEICSDVTVKCVMNEGCDDLLPAKAHEDDAAYDLKSAVDCTLLPGKVTLVPVGFRMEIPVGYEVQVRPRSGLALKNSIDIPNSPGTIDAGYRGDVCVILHNFGDTEFKITRGMRIAQMVISQLANIKLEKADKLSESDRGIGGFGSTGTK